MKKLFLGLIVVLLVCGFASISSAQLRLNSGAITTDTLLYTGKAGLCGVFLVADGTNAASVVVYDNTSAAGKKLRQGTVAAGEYQGGFVLPGCIEANIGIYIDVGANTTVYLDWVRQ